MWYIVDDEMYSFSSPLLVHLVMRLSHAIDLLVWMQKVMHLS
jgi:hypothetical protein